MTEGEKNTCVPPKNHGSPGRKFCPFPHIYLVFIDNIKNYRYPENGKTSFTDLKKVFPPLDRKHNPTAKIILEQARVQYVLMKGFEEINSSINFDLINSETVKFYY